MTAQIEIPNKVPFHNLRFDHINPYIDLTRSLKIWEEILNTCEHTFFQSTSWIKCWLESLEGKHDIKMIVGYHDDIAVCIFFAGLHKQFRRGIIFSNTININMTGNPEFDILFIEYNKIIANSNIDISLNDLKDSLSCYYWDELKFDRVSNSFNMFLGDNQSNDDSLSVHAVKSYFVDLDKVRNGSYTAMLSSNRRQQIRRSIRYYNENELSIKHASTIEEALIMLSELKTLHQQKWIRKGQPGVFSSTYFNDFHESLIIQAFDKNQIQILKVYTNKEVVGYLYNFIYNDQVLFYQCGFNYTNDNKKRPGLISHYMAIKHNLNEGNSKYDFLAGKDPYKKSLSTDYSNVETINVKKNLFKFKVENSLIKIKNKIKSFLANTKKPK